MRIIDADYLIKTIPNTDVDMFDNCGRCTLLDREEVIAIINKAPTIEADVDKVRHGIWIHREEAIIGNPFGHYECSICGNVMPHVITQYCCYCGAKMDVGGEK